jgi:hypothetical protein
MKKGGVKKMAAGGSTTNKLNNARGFAPEQKGGDNISKMIYGIPNAGMTGPNRKSQTETMKKGGAKKATAKKPLMKKGGAMKPLRKAQDGDNFQGPVTQEATNKINKDYIRSVGVGPRVYDQTVKDADDWKRVRENYDRIPKEVFDEYKKGGSIKAKAKKPLAKAQFGKAQKSGFYMQAQNDATGNPTRPIASKQQRDKTKITTDKSGNETVKQKVTKYDVTSKGIKPTGTTVTKTVYDPNYNVISEKSRKGVFNIGKRQSGGSMKKMAKGGSKFPDLTGDGKVTQADILKGRGVIKKKGGTMKAKFGASVSVQRSPKAGKVRSASAQGYSAVGKREPGRIIKKTIGKKK